MMDLPELNPTLVAGHTAGPRGTVYWVTGLAGSGKTTLGRRLHARLAESRPRGVVLLDGDVLREVMGATDAHTRAERRALALRYGRLCQMLADQGFDVVCCTISMFHEVRLWNRSHIQNYQEIFIRVPLHVLQARDQKGLYTQAASGSNNVVVGVSMTAEFPETPDVEVENDGSRPPDLVVDEIWQKLFRRGSYSQLQKGCA